MGEGGGWGKKGLGYLHSRSGLKGRPEGNEMGGTFMSGSLLAAAWAAAASRAASLCAVSACPF